MFLENNHRSQFIKNVILTIAWNFVVIVCIRQNEVDAAVISKPGDTNVQNEICKNTCQSQTCHIEANRLKRLIDESVDPCDNFYHFACGTFLNSPEFNPPDVWTSIDMFAIYQTQINDQVYDAIDNINSNDLKAFIKMKVFYNNCMNQTSEIDTVLQILKNIGGFPILLGDSWDEKTYDWKETLYKIIDENIFINFPMYIQAFKENSNSSKDIPVVMSASTRVIELYIQKGESHHNNYSNFVLKSMIALGANEDTAKAEIEDMFNFQIELYKIKSTFEEIATQTIDQIQVSIDSLSQNYPSIPWLKLLNKLLNRHEVFISTTDLITVEDRNFINKLENLINTTPKRVIANYLAWSVLTSVYLFLPEPFHQLNRQYKFDETTTRREFCFNQVKNHFSVALNALYVQKYVAPYLDEEVTKDVQDIVQNVKDQVELNIKNADWMDDGTRSAALKKIGAMKNLIGYEKELLDDKKIDEYYNELEITHGSFLKNGVNVSAFDAANHLKSLKERPKKIDWTTRNSAINYNAHYNYEKNAIDIPVAFLQGCMYGYQKPQFSNYGGLGSIVGHEIIHGFDNKGRHYDEYGNLNNWWWEDTKQKYLQKAQCIIDQYNNFTIPNLNLTVNGEKTLNENIPDNSGFKAAYQAYSDWLRHNVEFEKCLPNLNYTSKQMFWITSAANWCSHSGAQFLRNLIKTDQHSPDISRVIISFSNIEGFAEDFQCKSGARMNPEKRCSLW